MRRLLHERPDHAFAAERFGAAPTPACTATSPATSSFERGDVEQGFADADVVVEREFTTSTVHQGYIEPHTAPPLGAGRPR